MIKIRACYCKPLLIVFGAVWLTACASIPRESVKDAQFDWFEYRGHDAVFAEPLKPGHYRNPIVAGFYPDPSITRAEGYYYMVHSSFSWNPGVPIFRSEDLVHWEKIGHVLTTPEQLQLDGRAVSEGIFAPTLRYHQGTFYMITTGVHAGGNFFVTATDPAGPWSSPIFLPEVGGIDPDIFFDDDGRIYITHCDEPDGQALYDGHRALRIWEYDPVAKRVIPPGRVLVDGGVDITQEPIWIEAPHLFKHNGWYYLTAAEGGTGDNHSQVIFRSRSLQEPFKPYTGNPILTQRDLPKSRANPITSAGHADFVQTPQGEWWAVFLATRAYDDRYYNTGRETFLLPVTWRDGWPVILPAGTPIPYQHAMPAGASAHSSLPPTTGNFTWRDDFTGTDLSPHWSRLRIGDEDWFKLGNGTLHLTPQSTRLSERSQPSFLARRQAHMAYSASTQLQLPLAKGVSAGLAAFQNDAYHYYLGVRRVASGYELFLEVADGAAPRQIVRAALPTAEQLILTVKGDKGDIGFYYTLPGQAEQPLAENLDGKLLSTAVAGGFVGAHLGVYTRKE